MKLKLKLKLKFVLQNTFGAGDFALGPGQRFAEGFGAAFECGFGTVVQLVEPAVRRCQFYDRCQSH